QRGDACVGGISCCRGWHGAALWKNNSEFEPSLEHLGNILKDMKPNIQRIQAFNGTFDRSNEIDRLTELQRKAEQLVHKCSRIKKYRFFKKIHYNKKILELAKSIGDYVTISMQVQQSADTKEILFEMKSILLQLQPLLSNQLQPLLSNYYQLNERVDMGPSYTSTGFCSPTKPVVNPIGLEIPLSDLKMKLLKDDEASLIVLSAPGGCGKTTLAKTLCHDPEVKGKFKDKIFFVTVSKTPNLMLIVGTVFQHMNRKLPEIQKVTEEALNQLQRLFEEMEPDPILLVLDDVWPGSESESFLDRLEFGTKNYKILVTSRYEFGFGSTYKLQTLNPIDAMKLFRQSAFLPNENPDDRDPEIVKRLVEHCKGLPLAISVTGRSLRGKPAAQWRKRSAECSKSAAILSQTEVLECLQRSVDELEDEMVQCYMDLGSFPEDHNISAAALIDMWVELHNLDEEDAFVNLQELSCHNLLDHLDSYNEHSVMQHDLIRELAILKSNSESMEQRKRLFLDIHGNKFPDWLIPKEGHFPEWLISPKQPSISAKLLSISTDEVFESNWFGVQAPDVEILVLNLQTKNYTLPKFMERMNKLKVLIVNNHGFRQAELTNFALVGSLSNLRRIRLEKVSIPSFFLTSARYYIIRTSVKLEKLEKLSLVMCNIGEAFSNPAFNISDAFPNLVEINIDYCNDLVELPAGFCDLIRLKRLSITNCHKLRKLPEDIGNLVNLEILRLNSCTDLSALPHTITSLNNLKILDLSDCLSITELPEEFGKLCSLRKLYMMECGVDGLPSSVTKLVDLKEMIGDREIASVWERFKKTHLPSLRIEKMLLQPTLHHHQKLSPSSNFSYPHRPRRKNPHFALRRKLSYQKLPVKCSISQSNSPVMAKGKVHIKWTQIYRKIRFMENPELGAGSVLDQLESEGKMFTSAEVGKAIRELTKYKMYRQIFEVYDWMKGKEDRFPVDPEYAPMQLELIACHRGISSAEEFFFGLPANLRDKETHGALLNSYSHTGRREKAEELFTLMRTKGYLTTALPYSAMMRLYLNLGLFDKVDSLACEMIEEDIELDLNSYNVWLSSCSLQGSVEKMEKVVNLMNLDTSVVPNWTTFSTMATAYIQMGMLDKAEACLKRIEGKINGRDAAPIYCLLHLYGCIGKKEQVLRLWKMCETIFPRIPNSAYHAIISSMIVMKDVEEAEKLYEEWLSNMTTFDLRILHLLMGWYVRVGPFDKAKSIFYQMLESGGKPEAITWELLATGNIAQRRISEALSCLEKAFANGSKSWKPKPVTISSFFRLCEEEADIASKDVLEGLLRESGYLEEKADPSIKKNEEKAEPSLLQWTF
ncbi:hypothetical protein Tsubulata_017840, partial [Turnera subulata]